MAGVTNKLLAISWVMPPLVFPRSIQVARLLKALGERGWETTVVTVLPDAEPNELKDRRLADVHSGWYVLRQVDVREEATPRWLRLWRRLRPPGDLAVANWLLRGGSAARRELARNAPNVLVTFAQPWADHLLGLRLKRRSPALPWVAHFSDPWVDSPYLQFASLEQETRVRRQERDVISTADAVVFVTQQTADLVMAKYPDAWRSKVAIVGHAYDEDLLGLLSPIAAPPGKFRVVHTGNFYGKREPLALFDALAALVKRPEVREHLEVEFIGYTAAEAVAKARDLGLENAVVFRGRTPYVESLEAAVTADLLLLIDAPAEHSVFLPSKIVDYLMLKRPILGLTPASGASAEVLRSQGHPIVSPDNAHAIEIALFAAFERWRARAGATAIPEKAGVEQFDVHHVVREFEYVLGRVQAGERAVRSPRKQLVV